MGTMTPKNREELVGMLTRGFATSGVAFWTDATTGELLDALDAAGLAIVPKEPTPKMYEQAFASSFDGRTRAGTLPLLIATAPCWKHHPIGGRMKRQPDDPGLHILPLDVAGAIDIIDQYIQHKTLTSNSESNLERIQAAKDLRKAILSKARFERSC
jgi:hypothetical protein